MKLLITTIVILISCLTWSQTNLIANGGFDDFTTPTEEGQAGEADYWETRSRAIPSTCNGQNYFLHSPDLMVASSLGSSIPGVAYVAPYSGNACVGMANYELIQQNIYGVSSNQPYTFSAYIKAHEGTVYNYTDVKLNVYLAKSRVKYKSETNDEDYCSEDYTSYTAGDKILIGQVTIDKQNYSRDDWKRISFGFYLNNLDYPNLSAYNWLVIDLHNDDYNAPSQSNCFNTDCQDAYIWLDDIKLQQSEFCASPCSPSLGGINLNSPLPNAMAANGQGYMQDPYNTSNQIYVSPFNFLVRDAMGVTFELFNRWGTMIYHDYAFDPNGLKDVGYNDYQFFWDGEDYNGNLFQQDVYVYRLTIWKCGERLTYNGISLYYFPLNTHSYNVPNIKNYDLGDCCIDFKYHQDVTFSGNHTTRVDQFITAGNNVIPTLPPGDVVVSNGSNVKFYAEYEINLEPGFVVEPQGVYDGELRNCIYSEKSVNNYKPRYITHDTTKSILNTELSSILQSEISIFPNPIIKSQSNKLSISGIKKEEFVKVNILNSIGCVVYSEVLNYSQSNEINVSALPAGIYLVNVETNNNITTKKLMIK